MFNYHTKIYSYTKHPIVNYQPEIPIDKLLVSWRSKHYQEKQTLGGTQKHCKTNRLQQNMLSSIYYRIPQQWSQKREKNLKKCHSYTDINCKK